MFIGHFAVGFASQRAAPRTPLVWLLLAPLFLDVVWPILVLAGIEWASVSPGFTAFVPLDLAHMPWSHSLAMAVLWSIAFAGVYRLRHADGRGAVVLGLGVSSHWVLDWITHAPDLGLAPGVEARTGLGLWNSIPGTLAVEGTLFAASIAVYVHATRPRDRAGRRGLVGVVAFLLVAYAVSSFGPPPADIRAVALASLVATAVVLALGAWIDRHREPRGTIRG